jgi:hypothetical protein
MVGSGAGVTPKFGGGNVAVGLVGRILDPPELHALREIIRKIICNQRGNFILYLSIHSVIARPAKQGEAISLQ